MFNPLDSIGSKIGGRSKFVILNNKIRNKHKFELYANLLEVENLALHQMVKKLIWFKL